VDSGLSALGERREFGTVRNRPKNEATALKEAFDQARRFFENWRQSLKWQRLKPYERFAGMIERHWHGIAAYCKPGNKVSLGFVERVQRQDPRPPAACATKNISASWSSPARFPRYDRLRSPTRSPEAPQE